MKVLEFNTDCGLFLFEFEKLDTALHSHPTIEMIYSTKGTFDLETQYEQHVGLQFAVIGANQKHKVESENPLNVLMIEHHNKFVSEELAAAGIDFNNKFLLKKQLTDEAAAVQTIIRRIHEGVSHIEYDGRISEVIHFLKDHAINEKRIMAILQEISGVSESRLSHLFSSEVGISLRKYLVWSKLKTTIKEHLANDEDLFSSLIRSGFYDHPHFSKSFKNMLGVKPSKAYSSRNVQV